MTHMLPSYQVLAAAFLAGMAVPACRIRFQQVRGQ
jgi:hypothetical protein